MLQRAKPVTRVLLVDADEVFAAAFIRAASAMGVEVEWYDDLAEVGVPDQPASFHAMVASMSTDPVTGFDIAEYADTYLPDLPLILIAEGEDEEAHASRWPESVQAIIPRSRGAQAILKSAINLAVVAEIDIPSATSSQRSAGRSPRVQHS